VSPTLRGWALAVPLVATCAFTWVALFTERWEREHWMGIRREYLRRHASSVGYAAKRVGSPDDRAARWAAAVEERRQQGKVARLARIELPVEVPAER